MSPDQQNVLEYIALSYTWGDASDVKEIKLNGRRFEVTANLFLSLENLRELYMSATSTALILWIDAICINQKNPNEKGSQVGQMHHIYKHAREVVIWLGAPSGGTDLAFELMDEFQLHLDAKELEPEQDPWEKIDSLREPLVLETMNYLIRYDQIAAWIALHRLLSCLWWSRAWTLQELLMSKEATFICGKKLAVWSVISLAIEVVQTTLPAVADLINDSEPHRSWNYDGGIPYKWSLFDLRNALGCRVTHSSKKALDANLVWPSIAVLGFLRISQFRHCLFDHDKIYSILGLVPPAVSSRISKPNYQLPFEQVYTEMVQAYVYGTQSLNIICYSQYSDIPATSLPSWVPDWRWRDRVWTADGTTQNFVGEWHHEAIQKHAPSFLGNGTILNVLGIQLATIKCINLQTSVWPQLHIIIETRKYHGSNSPLWLWRIDDIFDNLSAEAEDVYKPKGIIKAESARHFILGSFLLRYTKLSAFPDGSSPFSPPTPPPTPPRWDLPDLYDMMAFIVSSRTIATTDSTNKYGPQLCLVPYWTEVGDILCQIVGCTAPVILRPVGNDNFKFIGDCYVYEKPGEKMIELLQQAIDSEKGLERFTLI